MISSTEVFIGTFPLVENNSFGKPKVFIHATDSWQFKFSKKCWLILFRSTFKISFLSHHQFNFLHQNLNRKHGTCRQVVNQKIVVFLSCVSILIVRNFHRKLFTFGFFSTFKPIFHQNYKVYMSNQGRHSNNSNCAEVLHRRIADLCS